MLNVTLLLVGAAIGCIAGICLVFLILGKAGRAKAFGINQPKEPITFELYDHLQQVDVTMHGNKIFSGKLYRMSFDYSTTDPGSMQLQLMPNSALLERARVSL